MSKLPILTTDNMNKPPINLKDGPIRVGDVVSIDFGPQMTVICIQIILDDYGFEQWYAICGWFNYKGEYITERFDRDCLKLDKRYLKFGTLKKGDKVRLNSGGQEMTILSDEETGLGVKLMYTVPPFVSEPTADTMIPRNSQYKSRTIHIPANCLTKP